MRWFDPLRPHLCFCGLLLLLGGLAFGRVVDYGLVNFDDDYFITWNRHVTEGISIKNMRWAFGSRMLGIWHPVTWLSYQLESSLFGAANNQARHAVNLLIHLSSSLLVYFISLRLLEGRRFFAFVTASVFLLHPQGVQVVAWVSERKELLAGLFTLGAFMTHLQGKRVLTVGLFLMALMSKPSALPLMMVLPLFDFINERVSWRNGLKQNGLYYLCLFFLSLPVALFAIQGQGKQKFVLERLHQRPGLLLMQTEQLSGEMLLTFAHYIKTFFVPWPLPLMVAKPDVIPLAIWWQSALIMGLFLVLLIWFWRQKLIVFGMLWFVLFWLPISGVLPFHEFYVADRYMYLPHVGLGLALSCLMQRWMNCLKPIFRQLLFAGLFCIIGFMWAMTREQVKVWEDGIHLFEYEQMVNPESAMASVYLANAYMEAGLQEKGEQAFLKATRVGPEDFYPHAYLGFYYVELNQLDEAQACFEKALTYADPARHHFVSNVYGVLVWIHFSSQRYYTAHVLLEEGLQKFPRNSYLLQLKRQEL